MQLWTNTASMWRTGAVLVHVCGTIPFWRRTVAARRPQVRPLWWHVSLRGKGNRTQKTLINFFAGLNAERAHSSFEMKYVKSRTRCWVAVAENWFVSASGWIRSPGGWCKPSRCSVLDFLWRQQRNTVTTHDLSTLSMALIKPTRQLKILLNFKGHPLYASSMGPKDEFELKCCMGCEPQERLKLIWNCHCPRNWFMRLIGPN